jgi:hypothetical protein
MVYVFKLFTQLNNDGDYLSSYVIRIIDVLRYYVIENEFDHFPDKTLNMHIFV